MIQVNIEDFKDFFDRGDFIYSDNLPNVRDKDIQKAINTSETTFNHGLYPTETIEKEALLNLTAHNLCNILNDSQQTDLLINSRSVDGISVSLSVPDWMLQDELYYYSTTKYGQEFLRISKPYLGGGVFSVAGATQI